MSIAPVHNIQLGDTVIVRGREHQVKAFAIVGSGIAVNDQLVAGVSSKSTAVVRDNGAIDLDMVFTL